MRVAQYKGYDLASTCATFSIYKRNTGRALLSDAAAAKRLFQSLKTSKMQKKKAKDTNSQMKKLS